jgi:hypothetical protein
VRTLYTRATEGSRAIVAATSAIRRLPRERALGLRVLEVRARPREEGRDRPAERRGRDDDDRRDAEHEPVPRVRKAGEAFEHRQDNTLARSP